MLFSVPSICVVKCWKAVGVCESGYTYTTDIEPIMKEYCTRCHNSNEKAGYNFTQVDFVKKGALNGDLLGVIKHSAKYDAMPLGRDKLSQDIIDKIECWINNGMK